MTEVPAIVAFVEAQYDEAEARARAATEGPWHWVDPGSNKCKQALVSGDWHPGAGFGWLIVLPSAWGDVYPSHADAEFIAANDPDAALADIAAKRALLALAIKLAEPANWDWTAAGEMERAAREILTQLAAPFSAHPDFDPAWATVAPE